MSPRCTAIWRGSRSFSATAKQAIAPRNSLRGIKENTVIDRRQMMAMTAASALPPTILTGPARGQSPAAWPARPIRLIVPYAPGGPTDAVARLVADSLSRTWGQQVVIENRGGAGTNIGADLVAHSDPDGYTMLIGSGALA